MFIMLKQVVHILNFSNEFKNLHTYVKHKYCRANHLFTLLESFADLTTISKSTHDYLLSMRIQYHN
jgi:hypothetical protein